MKSGDVLDLHIFNEKNKPKMNKNILVYFLSIYYIFERKCEYWKLQEWN